MILAAGPRSQPGTDLRVGEGETRIMGIVNVTPDSFSDGGRFLDTEAAVAHGVQLAEEGADILDIGGESTRPGHRPVAAAGQLQRILPVVEGLRRRVALPLSVDTTLAEVAAAALDAGADWINDTSALADPEMAAVAARYQCPIVLMHRFEPPRIPDHPPNGRELVAQMAEKLQGKVRLAERAGIDPDRIVLDPGLGFGTLFEDNLFAMADVGPFRRLGKPLLFGPSRKSFIGTMTGRPAADRQFGTAAAVAILADQGVELLRVHDVGPMVDVVRVTDQLRRYRTE